MTPKAILSCEVGNSRIAMACVIGDEASDFQRVPADDAAGLRSALAKLWADMPEPKVIAACSTNPAHLAALESATEALGQKVLVVGRDLPLPIETDLDEPERIGIDRLCSAAIAYFRVGHACVVASFGTAITIDCVRDDGVFLGGAILPGLRIGAEALARSTAALPMVELTRPDWVYGKNTREAIIGGLVYGARGAMRELTEAYATHLGQWPPLLVTGGDGELVGQDYDIVQAVVPELCLMGVALAYRLAFEPPSAEPEHQHGPDCGCHENN